MPGFIANHLIEEITMDNRVALTGYEIPAVPGSFDARDNLGAADGLIAGGSTTQHPN